MFLALFVFAAVLSIPFHRKLKEIWLASGCTALIATAVAWLAVSQHFGWMDRTFFTNVALCLAISFGAALLVGLVLKKPS